MSKKLLKKLIKQNEQIIDLLSEISKKQKRNFSELSEKIDSQVNQPVDKEEKKELNQVLDILNSIEKKQRTNLKEVLGRISDCSHNVEEPKNQRRQHPYHSNNSDHSED